MTQQRGIRVRVPVLDYFDVVSDVLFDYMERHKEDPLMNDAASWFYIHLTDTSMMESRDAETMRDFVASDVSPECIVASYSITGTFFRPLNGARAVSAMRDALVSEEQRLGDLGLPAEVVAELIRDQLEATVLPWTKD